MGLIDELKLLLDNLISEGIYISEEIYKEVLNNIT